MTLDQMIKKLQDIREAEGGNIQVFVTAGGSDSLIEMVQVDRADVLVSKYVFIGHCEDYHQCVLITGN